MASRSRAAHDDTETTRDCRLRTAAARTTKSASSMRPATNSASVKKAGSSSADPPRRAATSATRRRRASCFTAAGSTAATAPTWPDGDVFITGRVKDIIIRAGRHLYPQEIEEAVAEIPGMRKGGVAVFGVADRTSGTERLVVLAETRLTDVEARAELQARAQDVATDIAGTPPDEVVLAPPRSVPKTSSGKIRRSAAKELYERGQVGPVRRSLWLQLVRLALSGIGARLRRCDAPDGGNCLCRVVVAGARGCGRGGHHCRLDVAAASNGAGQRCDGSAARRLPPWVFRSRQKGFERIPARGAMHVFNHSSYMDALVLATVLPGEPAIVAKRELAGQLIAGPLLRRLGIPFVERYDVSAQPGGCRGVDPAWRARGACSCSFRKARSPAGLDCPDSISGRSRSPRKQTFPSSAPASSAGHARCCAVSNGFPGTSPVSVEIGEPIAPSGADFCVGAAIARRRAQISSCRVAESLTSANWSSLLRRTPPPDWLWVYCRPLREPWRYRQRGRDGAGVIATCSVTGDQIKDGGTRFPMAGRSAALRTAAGQYASGPPGLPLGGTSEFSRQWFAGILVLLIATRRLVMNSSLATVDRSTHLKVVTVALIFSILMVWAIVAARVVDRTLPAGRHMVEPISNSYPPDPQTKPSPASMGKIVLT